MYIDEEIRNKVAKKVFTEENPCLAEETYEELIKEVEDDSYIYLNSKEIINVLKRDMKLIDCFHFEFGNMQVSFLNASFLYTYDKRPVFIKSYYNEYKDKFYDERDKEYTKEELIHALRNEYKDKKFYVSINPLQEVLTLHLGLI